MITFSIVVFFGFLVWARLKYGMTFSVSAIYHKLRDNGIEWIFPIVMITFTVPIIILTWGSSAMSIAGTLIIMSGLASDARDNEITERNHVICATGGMLMAGVQLLLWQFYGLVGLMIIFSSLLWILKPKNHTYWIEVIIYTLTIISILS